MVKSVTLNLLKAFNSKYIRKLTSIVLVIILFVFMSSMSESGYAYADVFACYESCPNPDTPTKRKELKNSQECKEDRDYKITSLPKGSDVTVLSIHGGLIELNTSKISAALSARYKWNIYDFYGEINSQECSNLDETDNGNSNYDVLHITSINFDEPRAVNLVESHKKAVSIHGFSRTETLKKAQTICVGGANETQVSKFIEYMEAKKDETKKIEYFLDYSLNPINVPNPGDATEDEKKVCFYPRALKGINKNNIVNRANKGMNDNNDNQGGLQIELSKQIRMDLVNGKDEPDSSSFDKYQGLRNVIYGAINCAMSDKDCLD